MAQVVDVDSAESAAPDEFRGPAHALSPVRSRHHPSQLPLSSVQSFADDEPFVAEDEEFDAPRRQSAHVVPPDSEDLNDSRFRVNGIVVDQEIPGGAKPKWETVYQVFFQSSTPQGQRMAITLIAMVSISVTTAILDSVKSIRDEVGQYLLVLEIFFTLAFSIEYALRLACLREPHEFALSYLGIVDICALVPTYLGLAIPTARPLIHLAVLRIFRVLRVFRVLRLARFVDASAALSDNIRSNKRRIAVFLVALFTMILVIGCAMYLIEGGHDFDNIPISLYWTVVTITTVGYGDIAPQTFPGRFVATMVMFCGYGIIACPLILNQSGNQDVFTEVIECPRCYRRFHQDDANFCRVCGAALRQPRVKALKAARREQLRLERLRTPGRRADTTPAVVSSARSDVHLLGELDPSRPSLQEC